MPRCTQGPGARDRARPRLTRERLEAVASRSLSLVDMLARLELPPAAGPLRHLRRRLAHHAIDTSHFVPEKLPERPRLRYREEDLRQAAVRSYSLREVMEHLGVPPYDGAHRHLARRLAYFGIDTSHFGAAGSIDEGRLRAAVAKSTGIAGTLRALGMSPSGSARTRVRKAIEEYAVPTGHFTGQAHARGRRAHNRIPADAVLRLLPEGAPRTRRALLYRALREKGVPCVCAECGTGELWLGRPLVLEIDHVNGESRDNRIGNLRFLCPSCHSQTPTYARPRTSAAPSARQGRAK